MNRLALVLLLHLSIPAIAQTSPSPLTPIPSFPFLSRELPRISEQAVPGKPFSVVGPRGAILGRQDGKYEAWIFPWKIFCGMRMTVHMQNYPVPITVNTHAAWVIFASRKLAAMGTMSDAGIVSAVPLDGEMAALAVQGWGLLTPFALAL